MTPRFIVKQGALSRDEIAKIIAESGLPLGRAPGFKTAALIAIRASKLYPMPFESACAASA